MIHGHGGLSDSFIRIALKTPDQNRLLASRLIEFGQVRETEAETLNEMRMAG